MNKKLYFQHVKVLGDPNSYSSIFKVKIEVFYIAVRLIKDKDRMVVVKKIDNEVMYLFIRTNNRLFVRHTSKDNNRWILVKF